MGNWRERPRRNFRNQKPPWSALRNYDQDPPLEYWRDGIPLWEKTFCKEIGCVPWGKIVDSKNFIYCHTNVVNWDDSACEAAFHNAKRRYWAAINGHQCDINLPDPDKYIEQIDWSPEMDPELIEELDWAYYNPNMKQQDDWLECKNKRTRNSSSVWTESHIEDPGHVGNPWEHGNQFTETKRQGWSQWNLSESRQVNKDGNPWDNIIDPRNRGMVDTAWKDKGNQVVTSWKKKGFSRDARSMVDNAWRANVQYQDGAATWKTKGFASDARNNSWSRHQQGASNFDHYNRPGNSNYNRNVRNLPDRMPPNIHGNKQEWKYKYRYGERPKDAQFDYIGGRDQGNIPPNPQGGRF